MIRGACFAAGVGCGVAGALIRPKKEVESYGLPETSKIQKMSNYIAQVDFRTRQPVWVMEHLTQKNLLGSASRKEIKFHEDLDIPPMFRATNQDYLNSGYSRGHMAPAADNKNSQTAMVETFKLSNIVPQDFENNKGYWNQIEMFTRSLTKTFEHVYVCSGPLFLPSNMEVKYKVIGKQKIAVPTHLYKVILCVENDKSYLGAIVVPNAPISLDVPLNEFRVDLEQLEWLSGIKFFPNLKKFDEIQIKKFITCMEDTLALISLLWCTLTYIFGIFGVYAALTYKVKPNNLKELPKVTILRPLKGMECNLYANLESSLTQNYPEDLLETKFLVADALDPCIPCVKKLVSLYPRAELMIGEHIVGPNPKVNNLVRGYEAAKGELIWMVDSNIMLPPSALVNAVGLLTSKVGLVHHLPVSVPENTIGSVLEWNFMNTYHARHYLAINALDFISCIVGKSLLLRKRDFDSIGGIKAFSETIAEDNMIGSAILHKKLTHKLAPDVVVQSLGPMTMTDFFSRRLRWIRIRKYTVPLALVLEPFSQVFSLGLLFSWSMNKLLLTNFAVTFLLHFSVWMILDALCCLCVSQIKSIPLFIVAWILREMISIPLFIFGIYGNSVSWRGVRYRIRPGGSVSKIK